MASSYSLAYFEACRASINAQLTAFRELARLVRGHGAEGAKLEKFEPLFFNGLVLVLDRYFVEALDSAAASDGVLDEFRLIATSLLQNGGVMSTGDSELEYRPEESMLQLPVGEAIWLTEPQFTRLARAYFSTIEEMFVPKSAR